MPSLLKNLENRTAIVTGAGRGIGRAIAQRLAAAGAQVGVVDIDATAAECTRGTIGSRAISIQADVSKANDVDRMVTILKKQWGEINILVNNAGIVGRDIPVLDLTEKDWDQVLSTNLKSVFLCSRAVIRHMIKRNFGTIISMASIAGKEGNPNMVPYSVSKAGIICFTKSLAKEVLSHNIRVNCVAPALIETDLIKEVDKEQLDYLVSKIPMGRLGKPDEVAAIVHFLASDDTSFTTGQCFDVSGGRATY